VERGLTQHKVPLTISGPVVASASHRHQGPSYRFGLGARRERRQRSEAMGSSVRGWSQIHRPTMVWQRAGQKSLRFHVTWPKNGWFICGLAGFMACACLHRCSAPDFASCSFPLIMSRLKRARSTSQKCERPHSCSVFFVGGWPAQFCVKGAFSMEACGRQPLPRRHPTHPARPCAHVYA
jgi:hypothetical protein